MREKGREDGITREGKGVVGGREQQGETVVGRGRGFPRRRKRGVEAEGSGARRTTWEGGFGEGRRTREKQKDNERKGYRAHGRGGG
jgi:hypothetical protein